MSETRHPILADTSALVALAMNDHWDTAKSALTLTTTNVCHNELRRHEREKRRYAPEGSRDYRLHHGSKRALEAFDDDDCAFSVVTVVGTPSGEDAGEKSIEKEISTNPGAYSYIAINDTGARDSLRRSRERNDLSYEVVPPTYLLYVLFDNGRLTKAEFCEACADMLTGEGWTNAGAVYAMWQSIPVDCSDHVEDRLLPE